MTSMKNNLLVKRIKNLSKEMREMHTTINALAMNLNAVYNQNHELKASNQTKEKNRLRIGSSQVQACGKDATSTATYANKVP
jgi:regulator of replication initiation timing